MNHAGYVALAALAAYLFGGIPVGFLVARAKGIDITRTGSGNIGAANVGRNLGFRWGVAVFALDVLKGTIPTVAAGRFAEWLYGAPSTESATVCVAWLIVAICPVLGHNFSPFLGFRGGKGVATSLGVALAVFPHLTVPAIGSFCVWACVALTIRISSLGSLLAALMFPAGYAVWAWWTGWDSMPRYPFVVFTLAAAAMVFVLHRANIVRLLNGTESRLGASQGGPTSGRTS